MNKFLGTYSVVDKGHKAVVGSNSAAAARGAVLPQ